MSRVCKGGETMSVKVRPTGTSNIALIPSGTLSDVKAEIERQNIKFVSKYVGTWY